MSDIYRTPEEYAERYARTYGCTVEEAKQTAAYRNFTAYVSDRLHKKEAKTSQQGGE